MSHHAEPLVEGNSIIDRAERAIRQFEITGATAAAFLLDCWTDRSELTDPDRAVVLARFEVAGGER